MKFIAGWSLIISMVIVLLSGQQRPIPALDEENSYGENGTRCVYDSECSPPARCVKARGSIEGVCAGGYR